MQLTSFNTLYVLSNQVFWHILFECSRAGSKGDVGAAHTGVFVVYMVPDDSHATGIEFPSPKEEADAKNWAFGKAVLCSLSLGRRGATPSPDHSSAEASCMCTQVHPGAFPVKFTSREELIKLSCPKISDQNLICLIWNPCQLHKIRLCRRYKSRSNSKTEDGFLSLLYCLCILFQHTVFWRDLDGCLKYLRWGVQGNVTKHEQAYH